MSDLNPQRILVVDDDQDVLLSAQIILKAAFPDVRCLANPAQLETELPTFNPDVVLLDMNFTRGLVGGDEGLYWLDYIKQFDPRIQVVMCTAYGEVDLAVKAVKLGAADFVQKPWLNEKLIATVSACARLGQSEREIDKLRNTRRAMDSATHKASELVGQSANFKAVLDLIDRVAPTDANVLITGENGTGKELIAQEIHRRSQRAEGPLVSVDAGSLSPSLFESEMFGHVKGAFTDARSDKPGKFELASDGTLFLDEIGNLSLDIQAKLLRALESRRITRVGGTRPVAIDIRLVCATNITSEQLADPSRFRQDLLYRINTVEVTLPPLRERQEDIPLLLRHFQAVYGHKYGKPDTHLSSAALKQLMAYRWPGNIRELKHATERAIIVAVRSELSLENFLTGALQIAPVPEDLNLESLEHKTILRAMQQYRGNLTQVAKAVGLGRTTLYRKLEKYGIVNDQV
ncbi:MAG: sigma-54 dependent transcriptional regulator [Pseudohongiella sp.]|uniref:sigma-54-dependent transcriptional regulator n=1 Tax=Pseudohongiella sp. TaxID=1979412 RepID=UPI0034A05820